MRYILTHFSTLLIAVSSLSAGLGSSLDQIQRLYGGSPEVYRYRPDLYPTSYIFWSDDTKVEVVILPDVATHIAVFFKTQPAGSPEKELARFSRLEGWKGRPPDDPDFAVQFPSFSPKSRKNAFFAAPGAFALVQRDVGDFAAVMWIQTDAYLPLLKEYRQKRKAAEPGATDNPDDAQ
jgi:hypothetical protein